MCFGCCVVIDYYHTIWEVYVHVLLVIKLLTSLKDVDDIEDEPELGVVMTSFTFELLFDLVCIIEMMMLIC